MTVEGEDATYARLFLVMHSKNQVAMDLQDPLCQSSDSSILKQRKGKKGWLNKLFGYRDKCAAERMQVKFRTFAISCVDLCKNFNSSIISLHNYQSI